MKIEKVILNNQVSSSRYSITQVYNATYTWRLGGCSFENEMNIAYTTLIDFHRARLSGSSQASDPDKTEPQTFRNQRSTLNGFLSLHGKTTDSLVGRELRHGFDEALNKYLSALTGGAKGRSDKRGHMRAWKQSFDELDAQLKAKVPNPTPQPKAFSRALREAIAATGEAPKTLARQCEISTSAVQRWMNGAVPNAKTLPALRRLEAHIGLERGTLEKRLSKSANMAIRAPHATNAMPISYRTELKKRSADTYRVKPSEVLPAFESEWRDLLQYKTDKVPSLARSEKAVWRLLPTNEVLGCHTPLACIHGRVCPSAALILEHLMAYLGYLTLPVLHGGQGLPMNRVQSLGMLVVPELVDGYMRFQSARSEGKVHQGHAVFASFIISLLQPRTGYLRQRPDLCDRIPEATRLGRSWEQLCDKALDTARSWKKGAKDTSRDPSLPIQPLLNLKEPLAPVLRAIDQLDQLASAALPRSIQQALYKRDALLLNLAVVNPLRIRTLSLITCQDGVGNLYQQESGEWRLRFSGDAFKNDAGSRLMDYDVSVPGLGPRIDEFLWEYRPVLITGCPESPYLFPSTRSVDGRHNGLARVIEKITQRYIPEVQSFGPHAIRHLVASAYLKANPKDYLTVAELLHDRLDTVMRAYAHLAKDDSMGRYAEYLAGVSAR